MLDPTAFSKRLTRFDYIRPTPLQFVEWPTSAVGDEQEVCHESSLTAFSCSDGFLCAWFPSQYGEEEKQKTLQFVDKFLSQFSYGNQQEAKAPVDTRFFFLRLYLTITILSKTDQKKTWVKWRVKWWKREWQ